MSLFRREAIFMVLLAAVMILGPLLLAIVAVFFKIKIH